MTPFSLISRPALIAASPAFVLPLRIEKLWETVLAPLPSSCIAYASMQVWIPYLAIALLVADLIFMLVGSGWVSLAATRRTSYTCGINSTEKYRITENNFRIRCNPLKT